MNTDSKFASRKFLITMLVLSGVLAAVVTKTTIDPELASLIKWIAGLYFGANIGQKYVQGSQGSKSTKSVNEE